MGNIAPAVKTETKKVAIATLVLTVVMWVIFGVLHALVPDQVPFDYRVILGGIGGAVVAVLNFLLMGLTVQKIVNTEDEDQAKAMMRASMSRRYLMQGVWIIIAIAAPIFQFAAGIAPLLFPSLSIKLRAILGKK